jgi:hypothetical protein
MESLPIIQPFDKKGSLNPKVFYYQQFGQIPHDIDDYRDYKSEMIDAIKNRYGSNSEFKYHTRSMFTTKDKTPRTRKFTAVLANQLMVVCSEYGKRWDLELYHNGSQDVVDEFYNLITPFRMSKKREKTNRMFMVVSNMKGYQLLKMDTKKMNINVNKHYNDDFMPVHTEIEQFIKDKRSGLVILHGKQGTGKSSYIRHLITSTNKKVLYFTSDMTGSITSPSFIQFLSEQQGSIIVLEDCEELLMARSGRGNVNIGLSNILNMSDGLLADALQLKFICTFNAKLSDIDKALLRKGRLVARYEFGDLTADKANNLIAEQSLDIPEQVSPISLADLYHHEKPAFELEKRSIGF